jgi:beta-glucosidase
LKAERTLPQWSRPLGPRFRYLLEKIRTTQDLQLQPVRRKTSMSVTVANIGKVDGDEVVQVYAKQPNASVPVPRVRLGAFERIFVPAGQQVSVSLSIVPESHVAILDNSFESIYDGRQAVVVEKGALELFVGGGQPEFVRHNDGSGSGSVMSVDVTVTATATVVSCGL